MTFLNPLAPAAPKKGSQRLKRRSLFHGNLTNLTVVSLLFPFLNHLSSLKWPCLPVFRPGEEGGLERLLGWSSVTWKMARLPHQKWGLILWLIYGWHMALGGVDKWVDLYGWYKPQHEAGGLARELLLLDQKARFPQKVPIRIFWVKFGSGKLEKKHNVVEWSWCFYMKLCGPTWSGGQVGAFKSTPCKDQWGWLTQKVTPNWFLRVLRCQARLYSLEARLADEMDARFGTRRCGLEGIRNIFMHHEPSGWGSHLKARCRSLGS